MSDQASVVVRAEGREVWLYDHSCGHSLPHRVQTALARRWRWNDPPYLTRIIFDEIEQTRGGEYGYGIWTGGAPGVRAIVVDIDRQEVRCRETFGDERLLGSWKFEAFVALLGSELAAAWEGDV